jgi:hypothetical protein
MMPWPAVSPQFACSRRRRTQTSSIHLVTCQGARREDANGTVQREAIRQTVAVCRISQHRG